MIYGLFNMESIESLDRNAIRDPRRKWTNAIIPYSISTYFTQNEKYLIAKAMKNFHDKTCIRFKPKTSQDTDYVFIKKSAGCWSDSIGKRVGGQVVSLGGRTCMHTGVIMHELMHAAGFWHEMNRADRDSNIKINWKNILPQFQSQFVKKSLKEIDHLGTEYDTCSIMHYPASAGANGKGPTFEVIKKGKCDQIGPYNGFSNTDIKKLNTLYQCEMITTTTTTTTVNPQCTDYFKACKPWASVGWCNLKSWMLIYCKASCNQCGI